MPHRRNYRDRSRISRQDVIIQLHKRNDSNRRRIENSSESVEFTLYLTKKKKFIFLYEEWQN
uniref:Uncharacterized protein n=1 Tax=Rhizophagus irregularis (strain DAOM 181602 / DAOM 197198 / MUCL 43194) TaxID=747089 RepID=U9TND2_RHIID